MNDNFWVNVSLEGEEAEEKVKKAIIECGAVRAWAIYELAKGWSAEHGSLKAGDLRPAMVRFARQQQMTVQHFSLLCVLNQAIADFNRLLVVEEVGEGVQVHFPESDPKERYQEITFQSRSIWSKYLLTSGQISTVYGSLFMEGEGWGALLQAQAEYLGADPARYTYLWHSATLRVGPPWQLHFNLHAPQSKLGKAKIRKRRQKEKCL